METVTRRRFFGLLGGVVAGQVAKPIYVLPPPAGWKLQPDGWWAFDHAVFPEIPAEVWTHHRYTQRQIELMTGARALNGLGYWETGRRGYLGIARELPVEELRRRYPRSRNA